MDYVLNTLHDVDIEAVRMQLQQDAASHKEQGMYLEYLWQDVDNPRRVYFLFRVEDLNTCRKMFEKIYEEMRKEHPDVPLPEKTYLKSIDV